MAAERSVVKPSWYRFATSSLLANSTSGMPLPPARLSTFSFGTYPCCSV